VDVDADADDGRVHSTRNVESEDSKLFSACAKSASRFEGRRAIAHARGSAGFASRDVTGRYGGVRQLRC
jgi:hypothetical protein